MTLAMSMPLGHRTSQLKHVLQTQMVSESRASSIPSCTILMILEGSMSISSVMGQPELHAPHWKQRSTFSPLSSPTFSLKAAFLSSNLSVSLDSLGDIS